MILAFSRSGLVFDLRQLGEGDVEAPLILQHHSVELLLQCLDLPVPFPNRSNKPGTQPTLPSNICFELRFPTNEFIAC